jgi:hypothetical protein
MHQYRRLLVLPILLGVLITLASFRLNTPTASAGSGNIVNANCSTVAVTVTICTDTFSQTYSAGTSISVNLQGGSPGVTVTCNAPSGITCTVSNGGATVVCQVTCQSGSSFVMVLPGGATQYFTTGGAVAGAPYSAPAYVSTAPVGSVAVGSTPAVTVTVTSSGCPTGGYTVVVTVSCSSYGGNYGGGQCVLGSIQTYYGCTGASAVGYGYGYSPYNYQPLYGYGSLYGSNYGSCGSGYGGYGYGYSGGCGSSCGYGWVSTCGFSSSCSLFVFSCGNFGGNSFGGNSFNNNCGGFFGGFGGFGCNGFGGGLFGRGFGGGFGGGFGNNPFCNSTCRGGLMCVAPATAHRTLMNGSFCY